MKISKALTWDELAEDYNKVNSGRKAQTYRRETIFRWAERQTDKYVVDEVMGTLHRIESEEE